MKFNITTLEQLESLLLNPKVTKFDKYFVFKEVLKDIPILFIDIVDDKDLTNWVLDNDNTLVSKMQNIIKEIRNDPSAESYAGMTVYLSSSQADTIIDFTD